MPTLRRIATGMSLAVLPLLPGGSAPRPDGELWRQVEVIRTAHGVPHIRADNLRAAGYALAWVMQEDYGARTGLNLLRNSGRMGRLFGRDSVEHDLMSSGARRQAAATWHRLEQATRDMYLGFAAGVNRYVALHPEEFPVGMPTDFTGVDVFTLDQGRASGAKARAFTQRLQRPGSVPVVEPPSPDEGSNAWAIAPSRSASGRAMLLRNPHLAWTAGYYEAHVTVPGVLDFYGDFRIGGPFIVISGFNRHLGWATTNNNQDLEEVYALELDPARADHYLLDGASLPLERDDAVAEYRTDLGVAEARREGWRTPFGPVIHRTDSLVYVMKSAADGEYRAGEQFLRMMRATSLAAWQDAMRMRARMTSNFTYADRDGNIHYLWMAGLPALPHPPGGDSVAFLVRESRQMWTALVPYDSLPQLLNPPGGYIHQENSSHHFTNLHAPFDTLNPYANFEEPSLSLRSQLAIALVGGTDTLSLEEMIRRKHSYRMMLADRIKADLVAAVRATRPCCRVAEALRVLEAWDNTAAPDARGALLFESWWNHYAGDRPDSLRFARTWTAADPVGTPSGLADPARAAASFVAVLGPMGERFGGWDAAWGEVHRVRRGTVDEPVGGCSGAAGCFRTLSFGRAADGKRVANVGDAWVLAVEFGDMPRAYSVLAYGQSPDSTSPWHADQAAMFARGALKPVAFTATDVERQAVARYRPGEARRD